MQTSRGGILGALALLAGVCFLSVRPTGAATINVPCNTADLISAIETANLNSGPDTLELAAGCTYALTTGYLGGVTGLPAIATDITINGNGATIQRQSGFFRILQVVGTGALTLNDTTVTGGLLATSGPGAAGANGGGILANGGLKIVNSTITGNRAGDGGSNPSGNGGAGGNGGGIYASGAAPIITASTITNNGAGNGGSRGGGGVVDGFPGLGGGIYLNVAGNVNNSTISGNSAGFGVGTTAGQGPGGGLFVNANNVSLINSTISGNSGGNAGGIFTSFQPLSKNSLISGNSGGNCSGAGFVPGSINNMASDSTCGSTFTQKTSGEINLGPLADNGGPTQTMALLHPSAAIDAGDNATCTAAPVNNLDQRGIVRPIDGDNSGGAFCDIGAYEAPGAQTGPTFIVNSTAPDDDGACLDVPEDCTLREAINAANAASSPGDVITFDAGVFAPGTIPIDSPLPALTGGGDTIDGAGATVLIDTTRETGGPDPLFNCLLISSAGNTVKGLQMTDCAMAISVNLNVSDDNVIGPSNLFYDNVEAIRIVASGASGNSIVGNKMGTTADGSALHPDGANGTGITIFGPNNTVGGVTVADRNIISGSVGGGYGIAITTSLATGNVAKGNYIGTSADGLVDLGNSNGVIIQSASNNAIGGANAGEGNLIAGNQNNNIWLLSGSSNTVAGNIIGPDLAGGPSLSNGTGVNIGAPATNNTIGPGNVISDNVRGVYISVSSETHSNTVKGNLIGTNPAGTAGVPNSLGGIRIDSGAALNTIGGVSPGDGNVIAFNIGDGVEVSGTQTNSNTIRGNSIHSNTGLGINSTSGGNEGLAPPVITAVGSASGTACANCTVDVYSDIGDEGRVYHGSATADDNGDGTGDWNFPGAVTGPNVTATATNTGGSTSEFSAPFGCSGAADTDGDTICDSGDNCPGIVNTNQGNFDGDGQGDACDPEDDGDGFTDVVEFGTPLCGANVNHDEAFDVGDTLVNDGCPAVGPAESGADCTDATDNDADGAFNDGCPQAGSFSEAQFKIGTGSLDPCGNNGWPLELVSTPTSTANKYNISDLGSFVAPNRRLGKNPDQFGFSSRWDLVPGNSNLASSGWINIVDLGATTAGATGFPPMLGGVRALNQVCPFPP